MLATEGETAIASASDSAARPGLRLEVARKTYGRIAIANADAGAYAYTDCAIDQAYRAVQELMKVG